MILKDCVIFFFQEWLNTHGLSLPLEDDEDVDSDFCDDETGVTASCSLRSYQVRLYVQCIILNVIGIVRWDIPELFLDRLTSSSVMR